MFLSQLSTAEKLSTFSIVSEVSDHKTNSFNGKELIDCSLAGQVGYWHGGIWTATFTGDKKHFTFTCKDGFQLTPQRDYFITLD